MIDKQECYDRAAHAASRFRVMMESDDPASMVNAEIYRLASQEWVAAVATIKTQEFDPLVLIDRLTSHWNYYAETGRPYDDIDVLATKMAADFIARDRAARARAAEANRKANEIAPPEPPRGRGKAKAAEPTPQPPPIYPNHHKLIDNRYLNAMVNEFRLAFDLSTVVS